MPLGDPNDNALVEECVVLIKEVEQLLLIVRVERHWHDQSPSLIARKTRQYLMEDH